MDSSVLYGSIEHEIEERSSTIKDIEEDN